MDYRRAELKPNFFKSAGNAGKSFGCAPLNTLKPPSVPAIFFNRTKPKVVSGCTQNPQDSKHVVFLVGPNRERMLGLKSQMLAKSQSFSAVVSSQKEVEHPEYSASAFQAFLKYINTDYLCFAESHVCDLLRLAFVYEIPHVMHECKEFAMGTLSLENCLKYHLAAVLYELEDLQQLAFKFMTTQGPKFLEHPSFLELDPITMGSLVGRDDFHVVETDLFIRLLEWVNAECHRLRYPVERKEFHRRVCGNLFQHVRFAMMTPKEFANVVLPTKILNQRDVDAIQLRHGTHHELWHTLLANDQYNYIDRPRVVRQLISVPLYNKLQVRFRRLSYSTVQESLRLLSSQDLYFMGLEFYGPRNGPLTSYNIKYQIDDEFMNFYWKSPPETVRMLATHDFQVEFQHPYRISSQFPYKLTVWFEGQISQFGTEPMSQAVLMFNSNHICVHFSDNQTVVPGISESNYKSSQLPLPDTPGVIKSLLFQTVD